MRVKARIRMEDGEEVKDLKCIFCKHDIFDRYEVMNTFINVSGDGKYRDDDTEKLVTEKFICEKCGFVHEIQNILDCYKLPDRVISKEVKEI